MEEHKLISHGSNSTISDESMERKHAAMLERLSNRHNSRLTGKQETNSSAAFESTQSFLSYFYQCKLFIESRISQIRQDPDPTTHKPDLESISLSISDLEKLVAQNSYFLPPYEVRTCVGTIARIKQSLDDVCAMVIPKKKFSFKNKPSKKPTSGPAQNNVVVFENGGKPDVSSDRMCLSSLSDSPGFRDKNKEVLSEEFQRGESDSQNGEFTLSRLSDCEVRLKGCLRALFIDKLINCKVYVGAVMGSVLIEEAEECVFVLASHQIRIHNAKNCDFYLRLRSRPIIEDSFEVRFAPYCLSYEGIEKDLRDANLVEETGNWANVDDFRWLRAVQSPNWSILPENERIEMVNFHNSGKVV